VSGRRSSIVPVRPDQGLKLDPHPIIMLGRGSAGPAARKRSRGCHVAVPQAPPRRSRKIGPWSPGEREHELAIYRQQTCAGSWRGTILALRFKHITVTSPTLPHRLRRRPVPNTKTSPSTRTADKQAPHRFFHGAVRPMAVHFPRLREFLPWAEWVTAASWRSLTVARVLMSH